MGLFQGLEAVDDGVQISQVVVLFALPRCPEETDLFIQIIAHMRIEWTDRGADGSGSDKDGRMSQKGRLLIITARKQDTRRQRRCRDRLPFTVKRALFCARSIPVSGFILFSHLRVGSFS